MTGVTERFDRLPADDGAAGDGPTRAAVLDWWEERFGVPPATFEEHTFWERGAGKLWAFRGDRPSPVPIQGLGLFALRTGGEHWKPTTNAVQRFGGAATRNVVVLERGPAARFLAGEAQPVDWDGEWGYLVVARELADRRVPMGVGLFIDGELRSQVPKGRRQILPGHPEFEDGAGRGAGGP